MNLRSVSVIVPCKSNEDTIRETVQALLAQDYPGLLEVILIGSTGDSTWQALAGLEDPRLVILEAEPQPGRRDPSMKRHKGLSAASSDLLALADSDIVMAPDWLSRAIALLDEQNADFVAGGMRSIDDDFWGRFVDRNRLAAKTPRVRAPYWLTTENFGRHNRKPPIAANAIFTRTLYKEVQMDPEWTFGYEDYEWAWRVVKAGNKVLFASTLNGAHHHRRSLRALIREYLRAAEGCGRFIRVHWDSPLARKRLGQAIALPSAALAGAGIVGAALAAGYWPFVTGCALALTAAAVGWEYQQFRKIDSAVYPFVSAILMLVFSFGVLTSLRLKDRPPARSK